jgi:hypothetical protein
MMGLAMEVVYRLRRHMEALSQGRTAKVVVIRMAMVASSRVVVDIRDITNSRLDLMGNTERILGV